MRILAVRATVTPKRSFGELIRFSLWKASQWLSKLWPFRRQLREGKKASPMVLSDDILLMIYDVLRDQGDLNSIQDNIFGRGHFPTKTATPSDVLSLSMVNRRLRSLAVPRLFRTIHIGPGWRASHVYSAVLSLEKALPDLQRYTRTCKIDNYNDPTKHSDQYTRPPLERLLQVLQRLDRLENITLLDPWDYPSELQTKCRIALPQVKSLVLSPGAAWLIRHCPDITSIVTNDWRAPDASREMMYAHASSAPKLEVFCNTRSGWHPRLLQKMHENMPQLRQLGIATDYPFWSARQMQEITATLREFEFLHHLTLSASLGLLAWTWLDLEEKTYDENGYQRIQETIRHKIDGHYVKEETVRAIAGSVLHALPQLKTLFLGESHQIRVLQRTEHDETILAEIETRSVWTEWPRVTMVSAARPQAYIETCTLRDYSRLRDRVDVLSMDKVIEHELREMALETMTLHGGD